MSIIFDQGMLGFQVFAKDAEMERVVGKILIEFLYKLISRMVNHLDTTLSSDTIWWYS